MPRQTTILSLVSALATLGGPLCCPAFAADYSVVAGKTRDFDQARAGLTANASGVPGGNYCGPTAAMDLIDFYGTHGYPQVQHVPAFDIMGFTANTYQGQTYRIAYMGEYMSGSEDYATGGTTTGTLEDGVLDYFEDQSGLSLMSVRLDLFGMDTKSEITANLDLSATLMAMMGGVGITLHGRYTGWADGDLSRGGGHFMAVTGLRRTAGAYQFYYSNPATDEGALASHPNKYDTQSVARTGWLNMPIRYNGGEDEWYLGVNTLQSVNTKQNLVDDLVLFLPPLGVTVMNTPSATGSLAAFVNSASMSKDALGESVYGPASVADIGGLAGFARLTDLQWGPAMGSLLFGDAGASRLYEYDPMTGAVVTAAELRAPVTAIATRPDSFDVSVLAGDRLHVVHRADEAGHRLVESVAVAPRSTALVYEPATRTMGVLAGNTMAFYDARLGLVARAALPALPGAGAVMVKSVPEFGALLFKRDHDRTVTLARREGGGFRTSAIALEGVRDARGFDADARGNLHVSDGGRVKSFDLSGRPVATRFSGLAVGDVFNLPRNFDSHTVERGESTYDADDALLGEGR